MPTSLHYLSHNLGDDIQAYAVEQFVPAEHTVDRERLDQAPEEGFSRDLLLFGWLMHSDHWPPAPQYQVHPLAVHIAPQCRPMMSETAQWWQRWGRIPCRDSSTAEYFLGQDVDAEFSGCATLTLRRWVKPVRNLVVIADAKAADGLPQLRFQQVMEQTHHLPRPKHRNPRYRARRTKEALRAYQQAEMVVTSRLHVMLPCLAFGTPVLFIRPPLRQRPSNYTRLLDYLPYVEQWDGETAYESQGRLPANHRPVALIQQVRRRLREILKKVQLER